MKTFKIAWWEWILTKLTITSGVLFIITLWPAAMNWVHSVGWVWFLILIIVFGFWPVIKYFKS